MMFDFDMGAIANFSSRETTREDMELGLGFKLDDWQKDVVEGERLLLLAARQSGKSTAVAIKALMTAVNKPNSLCLILAPAKTQADELYTRIIRVYKALGGSLPSQENRSKVKLELENGSRIIPRGGGNLDTLPGYSPDLVIVDEAARTDDALFYEVLRPMLNHGGSFVALTTPRGKQGWFYTLWTRGEAEDWKRLKVPATSVSHYSRGAVEAAKRDMPDGMFRQEYLCEFVTDEEYTIFSEESFLNFYATDDAPLLFPENPITGEKQYKLRIGDPDFPRDLVPTHLLEKHDALIREKGEDPNKPTAIAI
jgi:hypothetical protein